MRRFLLIIEVRGSLMARRNSWLIWLLFAAGCGPGTAAVSGTVAFKGEPVPSGTVTFFSGGKQIDGQIQAGHYEAIGVPLGKARITVIRLDPRRPDPYESLNRARQRMLETKAADLKAVDPNVVTDPVQLDALQKQRHLLPFFYSTPETSTLRHTIVAGPNTLDLRLSDKPNPR
jgi:hypothetical protein